MIFVISFPLNRGQAHGIFGYYAGQLRDSSEAIQLAPGYGETLRVLRQGLKAGAGSPATEFTERLKDSLQNQTGTLHGTPFALS